MVVQLYLERADRVLGGGVVGVDRLPSLPVAVALDVLVVVVLVLTCPLLAVDADAQGLVPGGRA